MSIPLVNQIISSAKELTSVTDLMTLQKAVNAMVQHSFEKMMAKQTKADKKVKDPNAPKKPPTKGLLAWVAYGKHLTASRPDLFIGVNVINKQKVIKAYINETEEHKAKYAAFVEAFVPPVEVKEVKEVKPIIEVKEVKPIIEVKPKKEKKVKSANV